ncbi:Zn(2)-C6 fungal-type domain-containing protein [Fusarium keratoplasticum]|uniref:Zn(2)-C6 fungal-type domain-containing protein n=1 Tax=Fusarium keratoplasticum TaxID=1328300 RepID=A0ACC0QH88_9HYPO|nr:Zn(2)-C6 fungal-type domain-containing protein [Fusarium keratoplasticum]KAI8654745.1 Zn(2)-C6 fungal-type domain-containing protein [Fusarium keratoplasticum]KAI8655596.1 Zn(2)-C6 fungal-type domain-containing protein [Fusarium keratoplasticum]
MAMNYRPIKPAPPMDGSHRVDKSSRSAPKRPPATKTACWGCRKRKAKCDGQRPACANCIKSTRECVYDTKIRDSNTRALQLANQELREQLDASNLLLRQLASGAPEVRGPILQFLAGNKQPQEIIRALRIDNSLGLRPKPSERRQDKIVYRLLGSQTPHSTTHHTMESLPTPANSVADSTIMPVFDQPSWQPSDTDTSVTPVSNTLDKSPMLLEGPSSLEPVASSFTPRNAITVKPYLQSPVLIPEASRIKRESLLFVFPLFNRLDYLLGAPTDDHDTSPDLLRDTDQTARCFSSTGAYRGAPSLNLPNSHSSYSSPVFDQLASLGESRVPVQTGQSLAAFLRIHSNYGNSFGNLPLSSSIRANNYPPDVQDAQLRNFTVPIWAVTTLNTLPDPGGLREAFTSVYNEATRLLQEGTALEKVVGTHPEIAALFDQGVFDKSTLLSKWAAQMVHSVKLKGYDFTCFASMYVFWYLMRWMISPSPETYAAIPEWIRPTPNQLFIPHINMVDFAIWPDFRELVVQLPSMQEHMEWLIDLSNSIQCEWPYELDQALCKDEASGNIDLVDLAKQHVWTLGCWSVGPTFRSYLLNADNYVNIRVEDLEVGASAYTELGREM